MNAPCHLASLLLCLHLACPHALAASSPVNTDPFQMAQAVTAPGSGQAGYVHYFLITHPNGELEYHVGIELEDQRVAWSFPEIGVTVADFVKHAQININGKIYEVEHLHGVRPFAREADMRQLQKVLPQRVARWVDDETPYCVFRQPGERFCLNCGDFVVRVLFPGTNPLIPSLPRDFVQSAQGASTDDLLLYILGLGNIRDKAGMLAHISRLRLPDTLREDVTAMIHELHPQATPVAPSVPVRIAQRRAQARKL